MANKLQGKGIEIYSHGYMLIGYRDKYWYAPGNFITIQDSGDFHVGERYLKEDGQLCARGTIYKTDGTIKEFDDGASSESDY